MTSLWLTSACRYPTQIASELIAAIGELLLDVTICPEGDLIPDDDCDARIRIGGGGQAANFCAWAASLGKPARLITRVGDDEVGRGLVAELEGHGVEVVARSEERR